MEGSSLFPCLMVLLVLLALFVMVPQRSYLRSPSRCGPSAVHVIKAVPARLAEQEEEEDTAPESSGLMELGSPVDESAYNNLKDTEQKDFQDVADNMLPDAVEGAQFISDNNIKNFAQIDNRYLPEDVAEASDNHAVLRQPKSDGLGNRPMEFLLRPPPDVELDPKELERMPRWGLTDRFMERAT